jgi:hypothetical protein
VAVAELKRVCVGVMVIVFCGLGPEGLALLPQETDARNKSAEININANLDFFINHPRDFITVYIVSKKVFYGNFIPAYSLMLVFKLKKC